MKRNLLSGFAVKSAVAPAATRKAIQKLQKFWKKVTESESGDFVVWVLLAPAIAVLVISRLSW